RPGDQAERDRPHPERAQAGRIPADRPFGEPRGSEPGRRDHRTGDLSEAPMSRIKVLVVDDSAVVRHVLVELLQADSGIEVIAAVADPVFAMQRMKTCWPDVILLDVEMPRMDGVTFLRQLMQQRPTPVIICSTLTEAGAPTTIEALA